MYVLIPGDINVTGNRLRFLKTILRKRQACVIMKPGFFSHMSHGTLSVKRKVFRYQLTLSNNYESIH